MVVTSCLGLGLQVMTPTVAESGYGDDPGVPRMTKKCNMQGIYGDDDSGYGQSLTDFRYACTGYSVHLDNKGALEQPVIKSLGQSCQFVLVLRRFSNEERDGGNWKLRRAVFPAFFVSCSYYFVEKPGHLNCLSKALLTLEEGKKRVREYGEGKKKRRAGKGKGKRRVRQGAEGGRRKKEGGSYIKLVAVHGEFYTWPLEGGSSPLYGSGKAEGGGKGRYEEKGRREGYGIKAGRGTLYLVLFRSGLGEREGSTNSLCLDFLILRKSEGVEDGQRGGGSKGERAYELGVVRRDGEGIGNGRGLGGKKRERHYFTCMVFKMVPIERRIQAVYNVL
ncbi:hypothetical protein KSS87_008210 [Heliosperma pusillum]|nr:hypothetical protein KSS87_008210 [Heliosperma pusillum]